MRTIFARNENRIHGQGRPRVIVTESTRFRGTHRNLLSAEGIVADSPAGRGGLTANPRGPQNRQSGSLL
ncbi:hypothetical protein FRUB_09239 [Fimbriiglobus ruber]|uniref:Uncharacterized protein n=1 Tax=Fimbriiglobus ruber TaxID=1908690 RepID=A0A225DH20_9BACT|nr:hypothetical protein FRUB_09239 [Fimbriiglobus ruber]